MLEAPRPDGPAAVRQLAFISVVQVLALTTWFAASAAAPALRSEWAIGQVGEALLTIGVQLGFVTGALASAVTNLPDRVHPPRLMALGALVAALATAATAVVANGPEVAVVLRVVTGMALALVYPVGMKLVVSWFAVRRGLAVSVMVGALTLGSILPQLVAGSLGPAWRAALLVSAGLALAGATLQRWIRVGPLVTRAEGFHPRVVLDVWRDRAPRLANLGYLGHMWELYAVWAWAPAYLTASVVARGETVSRSVVGVVAFVALGVCGALGCFLAGWLGDRIGRARAATAAMVVSGSCCLLAAVAFGGPLWLLVPLLMVWGASVIADSAMFSACLGTVVDSRYVGTALTLQTALGFLLTVVTIQLVPVVAASASWPVAVALLAPGPLLGAVAMVRLSPLLPARV
ncbi:MFS transporter [Nocardioides coralli]|uniref:MFS transporter n=1 Tax=Nocardioides coralli TaxID=2872154 RepID=UPI001CA3DA69|nr:MFS transporter [Nocardioides coralli]QZY29296.1 MFS transporter [Nocardioides coralli]